MPVGVDNWYTDYLESRKRQVCEHEWARERQLMGQGYFWLCRKCEDAKPITWVSRPHLFPCPYKRRD